MKVPLDLGLRLNITKCELNFHAGRSVSDPTFRSFISIMVENATLLGALLFSGAVLYAAWSICCEDLSRAVERLGLLSSQDA